MIQRAAFRWGLYHGVWDGGDPTIGIKRWKTKKRKRIARFLEIRALLSYFDSATTDIAIRNRALFGLELFTGCRQGEARTALLNAITPYENAGCWNKGKTKTGEDHEIPITRQGMEWLTDWLKIRGTQAHATKSPYLFPSYDPDAALSVRAVWHWLNEVRKELGMTRAEL